MKGVSFTKNPKNSFAVFRIHYTADPDKDPATEAGRLWHEKVQRGMPEDGWQREYEINFSTMAGKPVYNDFNMEQVCRLKWNKNWVLYRGWDLGYHRPAVHFSCFDEKDRWLWLFPEQLGHDIMFADFIDYIQDVTMANFPEAMIRDFFPHDAKHVDPKAGDKNLNTAVAIAISKGLAPEISPITNVNDGINLIRHKMLLRADKEFGMLVDDRNKVEIEALQGGYHRNPKQEKGDDIVKDGYFEHLMDGGRSTAVNVLTPGTNVSIGARFIPFVVDEPVYHPVTGDIIG